MKLIRTFLSVSALLTVAAGFSGCEVLSDPGFSQAMGGISQSAVALSQCKQAALAARDRNALTSCFQQYDQNTSQIISQANFGGTNNQ